MNIPTNVFQISKSKPDPYVSNYLLSKCPNWTYTHYTYEEAIQFFNDNYIDEFKHIVTKFNKIPLYSYKMDLFKYYYLYVKGGVFISSAAMLTMNIENVTKEYDFFAAISSNSHKSIFQGLIGSKPNNIIIYEALKDAYITELIDINFNTLLLSYNLKEIIDEHNDETNDHLYNEKHYDNETTQIVNSNNEIILLNYWKTGNIPKNNLLYYLNLLEVYEFDKKFRCGLNRDGGYVMGEIDGGYDCYISAGVSEEESFSRDFINKYNMNEYNSFGFDGTIKNYPYQYTKKISFIKKNINSFNDDDNCDLSFLISKYDNIFLKMDIEGGEYPWVLSLNESQLSKFKQIVIEFHGIGSDSWGTSFTDKIKCFEKLKNTHYIIHAHGNNHAGLVDKIPDVIELTYINKNYFNEVPSFNTKPLPDPKLDFSNNGYGADLNLNFYPFRR